MSLSGIFDPAVQAFFGNQSGSGGESGGSNYKHRILANPADGYSAEFNYAGICNLKKFAEYFDVAYTDDPNLGCMAFSYPGNNGVLIPYTQSLVKDYDGSGGVIIEDGLAWYANIGTEGIPFLFAVTADAVAMLAEDGVIIPEPGIYVNAVYADTPWMVMFYG